MALKGYKFDGLSGTAYLPDDIAVEINIVPSRVSNVRSNQHRSAGAVTTVTLHETANYNTGADARMHQRWLHGGAGGSYVGFNFVVDDKRIIQLTPLDEITWAAGTPSGNLTSDHIELCVHAGIDHAKARRNAVALCAALLRARSLAAAKLVQHSVWYGKNCPALIRRDGLWPTILNMTAQYWNAIDAHMAGNPVVPIPDQPTTGWKKGQRVITTDALNLRQGSGTDYPVETTLPAGTGAEVIDGPRTANGYTWYDVKGTFGTGWVASEWLQPVASDPEPSSDWPYPDPVMPAWWGKIMDGQYVVDAGFAWYPVDGQWKVTRDTDRLRLSVADGEKVGPILKANEVIGLAALGQSGMGKGGHFGITQAGTRVSLDDLKLVREA